MKKLNRETWLNLGAKEIKKLFKKQGYDLVLTDVRITCSFPTSGAQNGKQGGKTIGQCLFGYNSKSEILVSPALEDSVEVLQVLTHELIHSHCGADEGHGRKFGKIARALDLQGKLTATIAGKIFTQEAKKIIKKIGKYPHEKFETSAGKKQKPRLIKATCDSGFGGCDSTWYASRKQWSNGLGKCDVIGCEGTKTISPELVKQGKLTQFEYDLIISSKYVPDSTNKRYREVLNCESDNEKELIKLLNKRIEELKDPNPCYALEQIIEVIKNYQNYGSDLCQHTSIIVKCVACNKDEKYWQKFSYCDLCEGEGHIEFKESSVFESCDNPAVTACQLCDYSSSDERSFNYSEVTCTENKTHVIQTCYNHPALKDYEQKEV